MQIGSVAAALKWRPIVLRDCTRNYLLVSPVSRSYNQCVCRDINIDVNTGMIFISVCCVWCAESEGTGVQFLTI